MIVGCKIVDEEYSGGDAFHVGMSRDSLQTILAISESRGGMEMTVSMILQMPIICIICPCVINHVTHPCNNYGNKSTYQLKIKAFCKFPSEIQQLRIGQEGKCGLHPIHPFINFFLPRGMWILNGGWRCRNIVHVDIHCSWSVETLELKRQRLPKEVMDWT